VSEPPREARDLQLLDAVDAFSREAVDATLWRVVREGRDPLSGRPSLSRWCNGTFDVLYTSMERDGAIAEIHALLSLQPVFPSRVRWFAHRVRVSSVRTLRVADLQTLARLGVDTDHYSERDYSRTQPIADAAFFLGFDGLLAPSTRWRCSNLVLFTDRVQPHQIEVAGSEPQPIDWAKWRERRRR
jgi:RES domain-containing protein